ncbi:hypothetical protein SM033_00029 [Vibrio phage vB_VpaM_sm033]|nr:hypothetical protein SM033_00029 [Vibrio phage vB_VpaM_sm033]
MKIDHLSGFEALTGAVNQDIPLGKFLDFWLAVRKQQKELDALNQRIGQMCYDYMDACEAGKTPACITEARTARENKRKELDSFITEFVAANPK